MSDPATFDKFESTKNQSQFLRGSIAEEIASDAPCLSGDAAKLIKHHGTYEQDDRDHRGGEKLYSFMVRTRIPGGRLTAAQFLAELDLCESVGNGTLRITDRQALQLHGVLKGDLKTAIRSINDIKLTTLGACGDVNRNVMCCPAPIRGNAVRDAMQRVADQLASHLRPQTTSYWELWLKRDDGTSELAHEYLCAVPSGPNHVDVEPLYGTTYLPRKFKIAIALPEDNCVDVFCHDLGLVAIAENDQLAGFNVYVGGGMGMTPANKKTFPAVGQLMAFAPLADIVQVAEAVVKVQRDFGGRIDRKLARLKYLIANWGIDAFRAKVEEYLGRPLAAAKPVAVTGVEDHIGWHPQGDGKFFLGINVENGRVKDEGPLRLKTGFRALLKAFPNDVRLTPMQGFLLCDLEAGDRARAESILREHGMKLDGELTLTRRYSIACPAYPTCGLAVTESERALPSVMDQLDAEMAKLGLANEKLAVHMTGCPNGCARPYTPDLGLVGKAKGKYTVYLGGNTIGSRVGFIWQDMVPQEEIVTRLSPILARFASQRTSNESFGDFCHRIGKESLTAG